MVTPDPAGQETRPQPRGAGLLRDRYSVVHVFAVFVALVAFCIVYVNHVGRQSERRYNQAQHQSEQRYDRLLAEQAKREQQIREERDRLAAQQREAGLRLFCRWVYGGQIDPALGPPTTSRGEKSLKANTEFYRAIGCKEPAR